MYLKQLVGIILLTCIPILVSYASEKGIALKTDVLRSEPYIDAKTIGNLAKGDDIDILSKQGAWLQIKNKRTSGWVHLLSIKRIRALNSGNNISSTIKVASGRAGTGKVVSTTGVRGLSAEDLKAAQFNETEIKLMESYITYPIQAKVFASEGGLKTRSIKSFNEIE